MSSTIPARNRVELAKAGFERRKAQLAVSTPTMHGGKRKRRLRNSNLTTPLGCRSISKTEATELRTGYCIGTNVNSTMYTESEFLRRVVFLKLRKFSARRGAFYLSFGPQL
jgi:hypothetical protein